MKEEAQGKGGLLGEQGLLFQPVDHCLVKVVELVPQGQQFLIRTGWDRTQWEGAKMSGPGPSERRPWPSLHLSVVKSEALSEPALGARTTNWGRSSNEPQYLGPGRVPGSLMLMVAGNTHVTAPSLDVYPKREGQEPC